MTYTDELVTSRYLRMTAWGYENRAPSCRAREIDTEIAEHLVCKKCGSQMRYEPWTREGQLRSHARYIAYAACQDCDYYEEF